MAASRSEHQQIMGLGQLGLDAHAVGACGHAVSLALGTGSGLTILRQLTVDIQVAAVTSAVNILLITGKYAIGEENPTNGEAPVGWNGWSNGAGGTPTIDGDPTWGRLALAPGEVAHSPVYNTGGTHTKYIDLTKNLYGTGDSDFILYIRGADTEFGQDDVSPTWEEYTTTVGKTWTFIQVKVEG